MGRDLLRDVQRHLHQLRQHLLRHLLLPPPRVMGRRLRDLPADGKAQFERAELNLPKTCPSSELAASAGKQTTQNMMEYKCSHLGRRKTTYICIHI